MNKARRRLFLALGLLSAIWLGATGCSTISLQSNKDADAVHKVSRLFVFIQHGDIKNQPLANYLATDFGICLSNRPVRFEVSVASPLELDENNYLHRMREFDADAVLVLSARGIVVDAYGGYPTINYDASLFDPLTQKRLWRAAIVNSGSPEAMEKRMRKMVEAIVAKLEQDGFL